MENKSISGYWMEKYVISCEQGTLSVFSALKSNVKWGGWIVLLTESMCDK